MAEAEKELFSHPRWHEPPAYKVVGQRELSSEEVEEGQAIFERWKKRQEQLKSEKMNKQND